MDTAACDRDTSNMGLFSKLKEEKRDDFYDEWNRLNLIARIMQDVYRERQSETDIVKSVDYAMKTLMHNFATSGQSERMVDVLYEGIVRNGIKLYKDSVKKVLAYINDGVAPDGLTHDTVQDLVDYTNEEFKKGQLIYIGETNQI
jgi:hypothetical protein|tara:strand:- start:98 stop:532 length:435 start_codon:yes stop_codon:yes gene_type:complete